MSGGSGFGSSSSPGFLELSNPRALQIESRALLWLVVL
jgi:hypothetical protein